MSDPKRGSAATFHGLKIAPVMPSASHEPVGAPPPRAVAPSLDGLAVTVKVEHGVDEVDVLARFSTLRRDVSPRVERKRGDRVKKGDTVKLDLLAKLGGVLLPGFYCEGLETELAPMPFFPGVAELIAGEPVGGHFQLLVKLANTYPIPGLREKEVEFQAGLVAASEVTLLAEDSPELLKRLGRGATLEAVMQSIHNDLLEEATAWARVCGENLVLDELVRRSNVQLNEEQISAEVSMHWNRLEGAKLRAKAFPTDVLDSALQGWVKRPDAREEAARRLKIAGVLQAIAERDGLVLTMESQQLLEVVHTYAMPESTVDEVRLAMLESPATLARLINLASYLRVVDHVMKRAKITYQAA